MQHALHNPSRRGGLLVLVGALVAAAVPAAGQSGTPRELRNRFTLVSTRAVANFRAVDPIEQRLRSWGYALHPRITSLRLRIEGALDEAESALKHNNDQVATDALDRAEACLDRYANIVGGE